MYKTFLSTIFVLGVVMCAQGAAAQGKEKNSGDGQFVEAIKDAKPIADIRYRYELKHQQGFAEEAYANTLRTRLGFETGELFNFKILVEMENLIDIGETHFSSTTNGLDQFPVIADPRITELNRAQLTFYGIERTPITIGRLRYNLNNQRFVGAVDFRQNQQTFDGALVSTNLIDNLTLDYLYINRVHRIFGDHHPFGEFDSNSHVLSASYNAGAIGEFHGYGLILDFLEAPTASSSTWGLRYVHRRELDRSGDLDLAVVAEVAVQRGHGENPFDYRELYLHGEATLGLYGAAGQIGWERLGGNGQIGFSTPLATLHKFQGFADVFLTTPPDGLEDIYGSLNYTWTQTPFAKNAGVFATYHTFSAALGGLDYGREYDAGVTAKFSNHLSGELKGSIYKGGNSAFVGRSLVWASLRVQY